MHRVELLGRYRLLPAAIVTLAAVFGASGSLAYVAAAALPPGCTQSGEVVSCSVTFTSGSNSFTVPAGLTSIHVVAVGGVGGSNLVGTPGGQGASVTGDLSVTGGSTLYAVVGKNGANGGGIGAGSQAPGGFGGGASDVRTAQDDLSTRLLVASGGGGAGGLGFSELPPSLHLLDGSPGAGGDAGGTAGQSSADTDGGGGAGAGGGATSGGAGGLGGNTCIDLVSPPLCGNGGNGATGAAGAGGDGGDESFLSLGPDDLTVAGGGGGGGGGGLFGGGGGGGGGITTGGGGGGGGSNLVPLGGSQSLDTTGVPMVQISYRLVPTSIGQCLHDGWRDFPQFTDLGQCVRFVVSGK